MNLKIYNRKWISCPSDITLCLNCKLVEQVFNELCTILCCGNPYYKGFVLKVFYFVTFIRWFNVFLSLQLISAWPLLPNKEDTLLSLKYGKYFLCCEWKYSNTISLYRTAGVCYVPQISVIFFYLFCNHKPFYISWVTWINNLLRDRHFLGFVRERECNFSYQHLVIRQSGYFLQKLHFMTHHTAWEIFNRNPVSL